MSTLETQYKNFLKRNPSSTFTFDEWRVDFGNQLSKSLGKLEEKKKREWLRPDWVKHVERFGNNHFYALECVCAKIIGADPTDSYSQEELFMVNDLFNFLMSKGEDYVTKFLEIYQDNNRYKYLTILELFGGHIY